MYELMKLIVTNDVFSVRKRSVRTVWHEDQVWRSNVCKVRWTVLDASCWL